MIVEYNSFIKKIRNNESLKLDQKFDGVFIIKPRTISNMQLEIQIEQSSITLTGITKIIIDKNNYANIKSGFRRVLRINIQYIKNIRVF